MIFAAGLGTRLKPFTNDTPKALVKLKGKPILEHLLLKLKNQGFNDFVINVHHFADQIEQFLKANNNFNSKIQISDERRLLLDTGGGLLNAKQYLSDSETILLHNSDIFSDIDLNKIIEFHKSNKSLATLAVQNRESDRKLLFDQTNSLCQWKNYKTNETKIARESEGNLIAQSFSGIHVINSDIFNYITEKGKFSIIDLYLRLAKNHKISAYETNHSYWFDMGKPENIREVENTIF